MAARSRRLVAQRSRVAFGTAQNDEEARAYLQQRLNVYAKTMFWAFVTLIVFIATSYRLYKIEPRYYELVFGGSSVLLGVMAFIWRVMLARGAMSMEGLYRLDVLFAIAIGSAFGASAALQFDIRPAGYTSLLFASFAVFTRALLVPSSTRRTAAVATATFIPILLGAAYLAIWSVQDLPGSMVFGGALTFCLVAIVIAANGSRIIYELSKKVTEAMQLGQYTLDHRIGSGGMGEVYHARHALLRRPTAVKLLLPDRVGAENLDRFEREVQHMSQLTHPNTVAVYDYGRSPDGRLYYAMEYLAGIDLQILVELHGPQPANRVVQILVQVCGALQEAHDAGLIHRDIKPANIILCERGGVPDVAKVVDFGLVKEITNDTGASKQIVLGTPAYIAPETITNGTVGPGVDLYALGAVGYYLLTGRKLFECKTDTDYLVQHVITVPKRPSEVAVAHVPQELEAIIMKCLAKQPAERHASARELAEALEAVPRLRDWNRAEAERWWREFRERATKPVASDSATITMQIDLEHRADPHA